MSAHESKSRSAALIVGAIGVVFGDIGTSPLYAMRDTFAGHHALPLDRLHVVGIVSLMFWSMMVIVTLKYVTIIMRADNKGEGGSLALLALINKNVPERKWSAGIVLLVAMTGAIVLTHRQRGGVRAQNIAEQVRRRPEDATRGRVEVPDGQGWCAEPFGAAEGSGLGSV